jgi:uncharacterized protein YfaS (alpha-2-macroglobulin family)
MPFPSKTWFIGLLMLMMLSLVSGGWRVATAQTGWSPAPQTLDFLPPSDQDEARRQHERQDQTRDFKAWLELSQSSLRARSNDWRQRQHRHEQASAAAINAYAASDSPEQGAGALAALAEALEARSAWKAAIRAWRASLALQDHAGRRRHLAEVIAEHGFRVTGHDVSSDARDPRICVWFSDVLARDGLPLADYVQFDPPGLAIEPEARALCITGVRHGERYAIRVRAGLPAHDGERLAKTVELDVYVRDRRPMVYFSGRAYVLPSGVSASLPIVSVNTEVIQAQLYRIADRALGGFAADDELFERLHAYRARTLAEQSGELLWQGEYEVRSVLNQEMRSVLPLGDWIDEHPASPGLYVLTAQSRERLQEEDPLATQWFLISDLGLTTLSGDDGLHVLVRSLASAEPLAGVNLRLLALNQQVLGEARTDARGYARFDPGLVRGTGGQRAMLLTAENDAGDYGLLDLRTSPFDLSDRGVSGRAAPKPVDVFLTTDRPVYRPGETVVLTALARDPQARALADLPLSYRIERPDGVEFLRQTVLDQGLGAHGLELSLLPEAMRGTWSAAVHLDPEQPALARTRFLVEDFLPERLAFDLTTEVERIDPRHPPVLELAARYLFGAPGADLPVEGQARVRATRTLKDHPGYRFGLADEDFAPRLEILEGTQTDARGQARLALKLPDALAATQPLEAEISVRVLDSGGRPVERELQRPVADGRARLGVRPLFEGALSEGGTATFALIALDAAGQDRAAEDLTWTLSQVRTSFQWYQSEGQWRYEPVRERRRVASGRVTLDGTAPARLEQPVDWGAYELEVRGGADLAPVSVDFNAGWFVSPKTQDTPDGLKLVLDRAQYRIGETARVHLEPRFPGLALVMVINQGLVGLHALDVPAEGAELDLPVTADWGAGAYVTAALYRPLEVAARRMPQRAIGLQWGAVDPGARRLQLELDAPQQTEPRSELPVTVRITNLPAGEPAYLRLALVDEGILNLTDFATPAPDDWAFGQRRLGLEIRDLYGRLIDPLRGDPARLRHGGDALALMQVEGPAPSEALLAYHSGIRAVDAQGRAEFSLELPDFNGRGRLMAMAWSAEGLGHGARELLIRDPIVVTASLPRFLAPGDESRLLVEATHVEGPTGRARLSLSSRGEVLALSSPTAATFELTAAGRARAEFPLTARAPGEAELQLDLDTPDGRRLTKTLRLEVRDLTPPLQVSEQRILRPGGPGLELGAGLLTQSTQQVLEPGSEVWRVAITGAGALDVAGLLHALEHYPHGCSEQLTSRALPLLYFDRLAPALGLEPDPRLAGRIQRILRALIGKQAADGGFGLWSASTAADATQPLWLDAYVSDFLTRAAEQGYAIPQAAFELALDNLKNRINYSSDFTSGGEGIAYALYVLTRNGRLSLGDLRYYFATKLEAFATPMARVQLGAALAMRGEPAHAREALESAARLWQSTGEDSGGRADFGSRLRDGAALVALAAEHLPAALPLSALTAELNDLAFARAQQGGWSRALSTQELAWLVLAARSRMSGAAAPELDIDGAVHHGPWNGRFDAVDLAIAPVRVRNLGAQPQTALLSVSGQPRTPPPAGGQGYGLHRAYFTLDGTPVDLEQVHQGQRLVVVLSVRAEQRQAARLLIEDPLPAGFEIDNPQLLAAGDLRGLAALQQGPEPLVNPAHQAFLADRLLAAVTREAEDPRDFRLAYVVRAVSPGHFAHPQARLEAMYQPWLRAWTDAGRVTVIAARSAIRYRIESFK